MNLLAVHIWTQFLLDKINLYLHHTILDKCLWKVNEKLKNKGEKQDKRSRVPLTSERPSNVYGLI